MLLAYARHLGFFLQRPIMEAMPHHASALPPSDLSDDEIAYLECERELWGPGAPKEEVVLQRFGVSVPVYYQRLYRICQSPSAVVYDAALVRRILDVADDVTAQRLSRGVRRDG